LIFCKNNELYHFIIATHASLLVTKLPPYSISFFNSRIEVDIPVVITCTTITIVKKTHGGISFKAIFKIIVIVVPKAKTIRKTPYAYTFPGNTAPIIAPIFVCKKV
jgi:hypothetical protein